MLDTPTQQDKQQKRKIRLLPFALAAMLVFVTACSGKGAEKESGASPSASATNGSGSNQTQENAASPFAKYDPPIQVSTVRIVNDTIKYKDGESIDNNIWTQLYKDELGIEVKNLWVVNDTGGQGEQKLNLSITSGDLPDFIPVNAVQLKQLVDAGALMDLTDIYEKYAAPFTKEITEGEGPHILQSATFNGKLMAIPSVASGETESSMIFVREDWRVKLNLPEPKTMDDVLKIAESFTKEDPDENGQDDTVGLLLHKNLYGSFAGLDGFFNGFHAYPGLWIEDASGKLTYGSIQPEVRVALQELQDMYKTKQIDREFGVKDGGKASELTTSGKNGLYYGPLWTPIWPVQDNRNNDPNAEWKAYPIVSVDGEAARPQVGPSVTTYYAVSKDAKNPEALIKMLNLFPEKGYGETAEPEKYFKADGLELFKYAPFVTSPAILDSYVRIDEALASGDTSKLSPDEKGNYEMIVKFREGDNSAWAYEKIFVGGGTLEVADRYRQQSMPMHSKFFGAPTKTMASKNSTLAKMELEVFTKIIMGDSIDKFDKFVEDWKRLGGDEMIKEVNEWAQSR